MVELHTLNIYKFNVFIRKKWNGNNMNEIKEIINKYYPNKFLFKIDGGWLTIFKNDTGDYIQSYNINDYVHIYPYKPWDPLGFHEEGNEEDIIQINKNVINEKK